jgi:hypothetical protein
MSTHPNQIQTDRFHPTMHTYTVRTEPQTDERTTRIDKKLIGRAVSQGIIGACTS